MIFKKYRTLRSVAAVFPAILLTVLLAGIVSPAQPSEPYFTGDGGKGICLAVLEPAGRELSADEQSMLFL
jgi:hypothetical protein